MMSFALVRHDFMSNDFKRNLKDIAYLLGISIAILFIAGLVEVFVTPMIM